MTYRFECDDSGAQKKCNVPLQFVRIDKNVPFSGDMVNVLFEELLTTAIEFIPVRILTSDAVSKFKQTFTPPT